MATGGVSPDLRRRSAGLRRRTPGAGATCADAGLITQATNFALIRASILCLINRQRALGGLTRLRANAPLLQAAQRHSDDMARRGYFSHDGPAGDTLATRIGASGYLGGAHGFTAGENIAWEIPPRSTPAGLVAAWMASPDHRANILDPGFRDTGIGLAFAPARRSTGGVRAADVTEEFGTTQ